MNNTIIITAITFATLLTSCKKQKNLNPVVPETTNEVHFLEAENLPYKIAKNYYLKTTQANLNNPKIETQETFNTLFGYASNSSNEGASTKIDFSKQYVIAVTKPETYFETTLKPVKFQKKSNELVLTYKYVTGEKQSFSTKPNFAIIVDKSITGQINLKQVK